MSAVKEEAKKLIEHLPEEATWDDIMEEFYFKKHVDKRLEDLDQGKSISHEEVKERLSKWIIN